MAIERSGIEPDLCVAIEDSERGLESATLAGIRCILVPTALTQGVNFASAYRVLESISGIPNLLSALQT